MLVAAALVPPTALLVPGAAGRAEVLEAELVAVAAAVRTLVAAGSDRVVVIVPGRLDVVERPASDLRPTLVAAGVSDRWTPLRPDGPAGAATPGSTVDDVAGAVGLWLLQRSGWRGPTSLVGAAEPDRAQAALTRPDGVAVLLLGTGSARRGAHAALAPEPDADEVDGAIAAWLAGGPEPERDRLDRHAASLAGPVRVLYRAAGGALASTGVTESAPLGVTYLVATWARVQHAREPGAA